MSKAKKCYWHGYYSGKSCSYCERKYSNSNPFNKVLHERAKTEQANWQKFVDRGMKGEVSDE